MKFEKIIEDWNYKCPECNAELSVTDEKCAECGLNFEKHILKEANKKLKKIMDNLPIPLVFWKIWETFLILIIYLLINFFADDIFFKYLTLKSESIKFNYTLLSILFSNLFLLLAPIFVIKIKYKQSLKYLGISKKFSGKISLLNALKISFFFIIFIILNNKYISNIAYVYSSDLTSLKIFSDNSSFASLIFIVLVCGIFVPLCEEIFFRGFLFKAFRVKFSFIQSAVLSSFIFGILYFDPILIIIGFITGILYSIYYEKFQVIWPGFYAHCLINSIFIIFSFNNSFFLKKISWNLIILTFIFFIIAIIYLNSSFYKIKKLKNILKIKYNLLLLSFCISLLSVLFVINTPYFKTSKIFLNTRIELLINNLKFFKAEKLVDNILYKRSNDIEMLVFRQKIYYYRGQHKKVLETGGQILNLIKNNSSFNKLKIKAIKYICLSSIELNLDYKEYFDILNKHFKSIKNYNNDITETMGWCWINNNNFEVGKKLIDEYIDGKIYYSKVQFTEVNYHLALLYYKLKKYINAEKYFMNVLKYGKTSYFGKKSIKFIDEIRKGLNNESLPKM
jgi:membrane protease YdiL (CAAX protease family)